MTLEVFLILLLATSVITGLTTEALKVAATENDITYPPNTVAGIVSVVLAVLISAGYYNIADVATNDSTGICVAALALMSWLCAMVGYDKVVQAITQIKTYQKSE